MISINLSKLNFTKIYCYLYFVSAHRYAHAICDRVPVELIEALLEKDLFICRTCRQTKCEKRGTRLKVCVLLTIFRIIVFLVDVVIDTLYILVSTKVTN